MFSKLSSLLQVLEKKLKPKASKFIRRALVLSPVVIINIHLYFPTNT